MVSSFGSVDSGDEINRQRRRKSHRPHRRDKEVSIDSIHFEGHLLRRVCGVTGKLPRSDRSDAEESSSECSLLEDSGEYQLMRLGREPKVMEVLHKLKVFSVSLAKCSQGGSVVESLSDASCGSGGGVVATRGAEAMNSAQEGYLRLFEDMLSVILKIQRSKTKVKYHTV